VFPYPRHSSMYLDSLLSKCFSLSNMPVLQNNFKITRLLDQTLNYLLTASPPLPSFLTSPQPLLSSHNPNRRSPSHHHLPPNPHQRALPALRILPTHHQTRMGFHARRPIRHRHGARTLRRRSRSLHALAVLGHDTHARFRYGGRCEK
jgi:hypothetical protein